MQDSKIFIRIYFFVFYYYFGLVSAKISYKKQYLDS